MEKSVNNSINVKAVKINYQHQLSSLILKGKESPICGNRSVRLIWFNDFLFGMWKLSQTRKSIVRYWAQILNCLKIKINILDWSSFEISWDSTSECKSHGLCSARLIPRSTTSHLSHLRFVYFRLKSCWISISVSVSKCLNHHSNNNAMSQPVTTQRLISNYCSCVRTMPRGWPAVGNILTRSLMDWSNLISWADWSLD